MNLMFIIVVCFSGVWLGIAIVVAISKASRGKGHHLSRWMGRVRQVQNDIENSGWRIQMIPYDDSSQPLTMPTRGLLAIVPLFGVFGFLIGIGLVVYDRSRFAGNGVLIAISGWLVALVGAWVNQRWGNLPFWDVARGCCVDRELRKVWLLRHGGGSWGWAWRIVCEYEYLGISYRVTPEIYPNCFGSEEAARALFESKNSTEL